MTVLLTLHRDGRRIAICNARCYNAKRSKCDCICGGLLHGKGPDVAKQRARAVAADVAADLHVDGVNLVHYFTPLLPCFRNQEQENGSASTRPET